MDWENSVRLTSLYNPFDPTNRSDVYLTHETAKAVASYVRERGILVERDTELVYSLNGRGLDAESLEHVCPNPGDQIVMKVVPAKGGGGGMQILALVAMVALAVFAPYLAPLVVGLPAGTALSLAAMTGMQLAISIAATAAMVMAGGMLINAFLVPKASTASMPRLSSPEFSSIVTPASEPMGQQSTTYGWGPLENLRSQGIPIPRVMGKRKLAGNVINRFIDVVGDDQYLNMLVGLANGPCVIDNVEINGQPLTNFTDYWTGTKAGTMSQTAMEYFGDTFYSQTFNVEVDGSYTTKDMTSSSAQGLRVEFSFPAGLYYVEDSGNLTSTTVVLGIEYRLFGAASWTDYGNQSVAGSTRSAKRMAYDIRDLAVGKYQVRVRVISRETTTRHATTVYLIGVSEIVLDNFSYPGLALLGVRLKATSQLSSSEPNVICDVERAYTAVHNGVAWVAKKTNNPAWTAYDILVRPVYECDAGGANLSVKMVDGISVDRVVYADFESWATYCDSKGLYCNVVFDSQMNIWEALAEISQVGRGMVIMKGTKYSCVVDKPTTYSQLFTVGNIVEDAFNIDYMALEDRANVAEVTYFDGDRNYQRESFFVYGNDYDTADDLRRTQLTLNACTSYDQAWKEADFRLKCNKYLTKTCSFEAAVDAIACQVGDVIKVQHNVPQWGYGGRVMGGATGKVFLDQDVTLVSGSTYAVVVRHVDDSIETKTVTTASGTTSTLTISGTWTTTPSRHEVYSFGVQNSDSKKFKVIKITRSQEFRRQITGIEYNETMYLDGTPVVLSETALKAYPVAIRLTAIERLRATPGGAWVSEIHISWRKNPSSADGSWRVYRKDLSVSGSSWEMVGETDDYFYVSREDWEKQHSYEIAVVGKARITGKEDYPANTTTVSIAVLWKQAPPDDVTTFNAVQDGLSLLFTWDHITDADRRGYEIREGVSWTGGTVLVKEVSANRFTHKLTYDGTYTYWIKAVDTSNNYSTDAASITKTITGVVNLIDIIYTYQEMNDFINGVASFSNVTSNLIFIGSGNTIGLHVPHALVDSGVSTWVDSGTSLTAFAGTTTLTGHYISPIRDLSYNIRSSIRLYKEYNSGALAVNDQTYPIRTDQTYPADVDDDITDESVLTTLYRASATSPMTSLSWVTYTTPVLQQFQYLQRKEAFVLDGGKTYLSYTSIYTMVDVPDRIYSIPNFAVGAAGTTVTLSNYGITFVVKYGVSTQASTGAYFTSIKNKNLSSFFATVFNDAGALVSNVVDIFLKGY